MLSIFAKYAYKAYKICAPRVSARGACKRRNLHLLYPLGILTYEFPENNGAAQRDGDQVDDVSMSYGHTDGSDEGGRQPAPPAKAARVETCRRRSRGYRPHGRQPAGGGHAGIVRTGNVHAGDDHAGLTTRSATCRSDHAGNDRAGNVHAGNVHAKRGRTICAQ